ARSHALSRHAALPIFGLETADDLARQCATGCVEPFGDELAQAVAGAFRTISRLSCRGRRHAGIARGLRTPRSLAKHLAPTSRQFLSPGPSPMQAALGLTPPSRRPISLALRPLVRAVGS